MLLPALWSKGVMQYGYIFTSHLSDGLSEPEEEWLKSVSTYRNYGLSYKADILKVKNV